MRKEERLPTRHATRNVTYKWCDVCLFYWWSSSVTEWLWVLFVVRFSSHVDCSIFAMLAKLALTQLQTCLISNRLRLSSASSRSDYSLVLRSRLLLVKRSQEHFNFHSKFVFLLTQFILLLAHQLQVLTQHLFVLLQLVVFLNHLGVVVERQSWQLAVLSHELDEVFLKAHAVMLLLHVLRVALFWNIVSEMEVKGTVIQMDEDTLHHSLCVHELLRGSSHDVDDCELEVIGGDNERHLLYVKLGYFDRAKQGEISVDFSHNSHILDDEFPLQIDIFF